MVPSHVQGIYGILTEKKKCFFVLRIKLQTFVMGGFRGGPRGPHPPFSVNFLCVCEEFLVK